MYSGAGTVTTTRMQQQLVRILLLALVLVALCRPAVAIEARGQNHGQYPPSTVSVAEDEDRSASERVEVETTTTEQQLQGQDERQPTTTTVGYNAVATTPKIVPVVKQLSRYEQGLEDYDEAADRAEREQQLQQQEQNEEQSLQQQYSGMVKPMLTLFNVISTVLSSGRSMRAMVEAAPDGGNKTVNSTFGAKSTSGDGGIATTNTTADGAHNENETATGAVTGGRYIKGDPLNGYYDFVISEGSYKFWVVFQLFTAALVLYATFAAIYYSKVSPLTSDYDYIDYLNGARSFSGGRSMVPMGSPGGGGDGPGRIWDTVANNRWFGPAAQAFEMVMSAIENAPK
ncbi:uncharacterized protein LOC125959578 [Anopheles darlingi]|uniref:uncharacterized protein LOC125959578 n=1 Tax=Anopheles darlingi TaxID=43151 RepID=UPI0021005E79|nr:uncharacterized protein LOC125959578 [Anopheles darlingi]